MFSLAVKTTTSWAAASLTAISICLAACDRGAQSTSADRHAPADLASPAAGRTTSRDTTHTRGKAPADGFAFTGDEKEFALFDPRLKQYVQMAQTDLRRALQQISSDIPKEEQDSLRKDLLVFLSRRSLDPLPVVIAEFREPDVKHGALSAIARDWAKSERDSNEILQFAKANLGPEDRDKLLSDFVARKMVPGKHELAAALVKEMPASTSRLATIAALAESWGRSALDSALGWAKSLPQTEERDRAMGSLAPQIASKYGLEGVTQALTAASSERTKSSYLREAAKLLQSEEPAGATRWLQSLPPELQRDAVPLVLRSVARDALDEVARNVFELPDRKVREAAVSAVARRMVEDNPSAAAGWVVQLPEDVKPVGLSTLVSRWYHADSEGLSQWISSLPGGRDRDIALSYLVPEVSATDKKTANELLSQIQDPKIRETASRRR